VAQQSQSGLGRLIFEDSRSHAIKHTFAVGLLWRIDQLVAKADTCTKFNGQKIWIFMISGA